MVSTQGAGGETGTVRRNDRDFPWRTGAFYRPAAGAERRLIPTSRWMPGCSAGFGQAAEVADRLRTCVVED